MRFQTGRRRGSVAVEFVLVAAFFFIPLALGLMSVGIALTRSLQVAQLTRDVGRMFVRGVDFSQQANQELITGSSSRPNLPALARGLGMQGNGGNATGGTTGKGVIVLSTMTRLSNTCGCNNAGHIVVSRRVVVGNKTLHTSSFGNPSSNLIDPATGAVSDYANDPAVRADNFSTLINLNQGELGYLIESSFKFPELIIPGVYTDPGASWRAVF